MKKTVLFFMFLLLSCILYANEPATIVCDGDGLLAYTGNSGVVCTSIQVLSISNGQPLLTIQGCNESKCSYSIASLDKGVYVVVLYMSDGSTYSTKIIK